MTKYIALFFFLLQSVFATVEANPYIDIQTNHGTITVELMPDKAPITVANFLGYVDTGFYDNTLFHRVIKDFMVQAGNSASPSIQKTTLAPIKLESDNGLKNQRGTIAMARKSDPDSAVAQFFINSVDNDFLNYKNSSSPGYAVFGLVTEGMDIIDSINAVKTGLRDAPIEKVIIDTIRPREGGLTFTGMQKKYVAGDMINLSLKESGIKREKLLDLWVAVLLPNGQFLYLSKKGTFNSSTTTLFKSAVKVEEISHKVLQFTVPTEFKGQYTLFAIFNKVGTDIADLTHTLRSNIASVRIDITN